MIDDLECFVNGVLWLGFFGMIVLQWLCDELSDGLVGVVYFGQNVSDELFVFSVDIFVVNLDVLIGIDEEGGSVIWFEFVFGLMVLGVVQFGFFDDFVVLECMGVEFVCCV